MKATGVPLVLLVLFYLYFSVYSHHQNLLLSVYDFLVRSNSKLGRFAFFVVFIFIIIIISLGSTKTSEADFGGFFPQTSLFYESISNTTTIDIDDKFQCSDNVDDNEHQGYDGSDEDINSDDIGGEEEDDDDDDDENGTDNEHQGYDGSDEDNNEDINSDGIGSEEDDDNDDENDDTSNEMEKRVEEFITKVKQKWREELLTDRLLCITSA